MGEWVKTRNLSRARSDKETSAMAARILGPRVAQ
jgi:hypothetical protein